ncbi:MAG TPA: hypothetical protein VIY48_20670, partial [Candidatus Paceibacterota bacterium]
CSSLCWRPSSQWSGSKEGGCEMEGSRVRKLFVHYWGPQSGGPQACVKYGYGVWHTIGRLRRKRAKY